MSLRCHYEKWLHRITEAIEEVYDEDDNLPIVRGDGIELEVA